MKVPVNAYLIPRLEEFIASKILKQPDRRIGIDEPLITSGLIDSFSLVDLALFVEDAFSVRIEDTELNASTFDTLAQLALLIEARRPA
jgi:acyl carrier protein